MNAFETRLIETGGEIQVPFSECGQGYGKDAEFYYRWTREKTEVGIRESFDRWANSCDFVLHRPTERVDIDIVRHACHLAMDAGHKDSGYALFFDIGQFYQKAKRNMR